jgi:hypothetical protein
MSRNPLRTSYLKMILLVRIPVIDPYLETRRFPINASYVQVDDFRVRRHKDVTYWTSAQALPGVGQTFGSACVRTAMR